MATPTVPVTVDLSSFSGEDLAGVTVRARLDVNEVYEGIVISVPAEATTDSEGVAVLDLFPNAPSPTGLGTQGSTYRITASIPGGRSLNVEARVPSEACRLEDILVSDQIPSLGAAELAVLMAQAHAASASSSADTATTQADAAAASAATAAAAAATISDSVSDAAASADEAEASASAAAASAAAADSSSDGVAEAAHSAEVARAAALSLFDRISVSVDEATESTAQTLLGDFEEGVAIDCTTASLADQIYIKDEITPANDLIGSLLDSGCVNMTSPKLVRQVDGSYKWSPHNFLRNCSDLSDATWTKTNVSVTTGVAGLEATSAFRLTSTNTTSASISDSTVANVIPDRTNMIEIIVHSGGTAAFLWMALVNSSTQVAYFNLSTGAVGTVSSGVTAEAFSTDGDGNALPSGSRRYTIRHENTSLSPNAYFGFCDADNAKAVTNGATLIVERPHMHYGTKTLPFVPTTSAARYAPAFEYRAGDTEQTLRLDLTVNSFSKHGNDLTESDWTATDGTPAFDQTGPDGETCSSFLATDANATVSQAVTAAGVNQTVSLIVKRLVGTGGIFLSADDGVTETEITEGVSTAWSRHFVHRTSANPTMRLRLATSGDKVAVAYFHQSSNQCMACPLPTYGDISVGRTGELLSLATSDFHFASENTIFVDLYTQPDDVADSGVDAGFDGGAEYAKFSAFDGLVRVYANDGAGLVSHIVGNFEHGDRLEMGMRCGLPKNWSASYNREPTLFNPTVEGVPSITSFQIAPYNAPVHVRRVLVLPEGVPDDELRTFRASERTDTRAASILACTQVAASGMGEYEGMRRYAYLEILNDTPLYADVIQFSSEKNDLVPSEMENPEAPARIMQRTYRYHKATPRFEALTEEIEFFRPTNYDTGFGDCGGPTPIKIKHGPKKGRLLCLFYQNDTPAATTYATVTLNLYIKKSDDNGATWTSPVKLLDRSALSANPGANVIPGGDNATYVQFAHDSDYPHRIVISVADYMGKAFASYWTEDGGETWTLGTILSAVTAGFSVYDPTETTLAMRPDGTLVMTWRLETGAVGQRAWATSTDGGQTWNYEGLTPTSDYFGTVNAGFAQADPEGGVGINGRFLISTGELGRINFKVSACTDDALTFEEYIRFASPNRYIGYSSMKVLNTGEILMSYESGTVAFNENNSQYLIALEDPS